MIKIKRYFLITIFHFTIITFQVNSVEVSSYARVIKHGGSSSTNGDKSDSSLSNESIKIHRVDESAMKVPEFIYPEVFNQTQQPPPATAPASTGRAFGGDSRPFPIQLLNPIYRPAATLRPSAIYPNHRLTESSKSRIVYPTTNRRISMVQQPTKLQAQDRFFPGESYGASFVKAAREKNNNPTGYSYQPPAKSLSNNQQPSATNQASPTFDSPPVTIEPFIPTIPVENKHGSPYLPPDKSIPIKIYPIYSPVNDLTTEKYKPPKELYNFPPNLNSSYLPPHSSVPKDKLISSYLPPPAGPIVDDSSQESIESDSVPPNIKIHYKPVKIKEIDETINSYLPPPSGSEIVKDPNESNDESSEETEEYQPPKELYNFPPLLNASYLPPHSTATKEKPISSYLPPPAGPVDDSSSDPSDLDSFPPNHKANYEPVKSNKINESINSYLPPPSGSHFDESPSDELDEEIEEYHPPKKLYNFPPNLDANYLPPGKHSTETKELISSYLPPPSGPISSKPSVNSQYLPPVVTDRYKPQINPNNFPPNLNSNYASHKPNIKNKTINSYLPPPAGPVYGRFPGPVSPDVLASIGKPVADTGDSEDDGGDNGKPDTGANDDNGANADDMGDDADTKDADGPGPSEASKFNDASADDHNQAPPLDSAGPVELDYNPSDHHHHDHPHEHHHDHHHPDYHDFPSYYNGPTIIDDSYPLSAPDHHDHYYPEIIYDHYPHHDHHFIEHHTEPITTTTTTTEAPEEEEPQPRVKKYSYFYLGRKLWYIPLYFTVWFTFYVAFLIIKSIARHKVDLPNHLQSKRSIHDLTHLEMVEKVDRLTYFVMKQISEFKDKSV